MIIKVFSWLPRSFVHVTEVFNKAKVDGLNPTFEKGVVSFKINGLGLFSLNSDGVYSITTKLPDTNIEERIKGFSLNASRKLFELINNFHNVTSKQLSEGIIDANFLTVVLTNKSVKRVNYNSIKFNGLSVLIPTEYYSDEPIFFVGNYLRAELLIDYLAFTNLIGRFFYDMMNKMELYHNGTQEVISLLESDPESDLITNAYLNFDLVKKDASESWFKVEQAIDCLYRKKNEFDSLRLASSVKIIADKLAINDRFNKLMADKDYTLSLWNLLVSHLEYVDTAVESRINYQNMVSNRLNKWFSIINAGFIIALLSLIVSSANPVNGVGLIIAWVLSYIISSIIIKRDNVS